MAISLKQLLLEARGPHTYKPKYIAPAVDPDQSGHEPTRKNAAMMMYDFYALELIMYKLLYEPYVKHKFGDSLEGYKKQIASKNHFYAYLKAEREQKNQGSYIPSLKDPSKQMKYKKESRFNCSLTAK